MSVRAFAAIALAALALMAWLMLTRPGMDASTTAMATSPEASSSTNRENEAATSPARAPSTQAGSLPVSVIHDQDVAACRGVAAAIRCQQQWSRLRMARASGHLTQPELEPACTAPTSRQVPWRALFEAAKRGHVPSMTAFGTRRFGEEWELEAMALYRAHAYDFLTRAAAAGEGAAIARLAHEMVEAGQGEGAIPYDRVRGLAYARVLLRHADADWRQTLENRLIGSRLRFTPEEWARAEFLSHEILPPAAEARLEGWAPNRDGPENDYGCAG